MAIQEGIVVQNRNLPLIELALGPKCINSLSSFTKQVMVSIQSWWSSRADYTLSTSLPLWPKWDAVSVLQSGWLRKEI